MDSLRGQLLIASPALLDPNFFRAVVLVTSHTEEGAMGLVLNNPSEAAVDEAAPELAVLVEPGARVRVGGPVEPAAALVLAELEDPAEAAEIVFGDIGFLAGGGDLAALAGSVRRAGIYAGYAGWAPGQLEAELEEGSWIVEPAGPDDVFAEDADGLWSTVLRRKGGRYRLLALMPLDPSAN